MDGRRREEEEEEEEEKKKGRSKVWKLNLSMELYGFLYT